MSRATPQPVTTGESARRQLLAGLDIMEQTVELAGIRTAILETGDGPPLVLLHGPGEFKERWIRIIPALSRTHRVIAPDFPGPGQSGNLRGQLGVPPIPIADLESIATPTELVWGRDDRANRLRIAEAASKRFGWPLDVIDGAAGDPPME